LLENDPNLELVGKTVRQVIEIECNANTIEYSTLVFKNNETGELIQGEFPDGVNSPVQFGPNLKAKAIYLREEQHLSYERISEYFLSVFGITISEATLVNIIRETEQSPVLDDFEEAAKRDIIEAPVANADESGISVNGVNHWVHDIVT
jgi:transposase